MCFRHRRPNTQQAKVTEFSDDGIAASYDVTVQTVYKEAPKTKELALQKAGKLAAFNSATPRRQQQIINEVKTSPHQIGDVFLGFTPATGVSGFMISCELYENNEKLDFPNRDLFKRAFKGPLMNHFNAATVKAQLDTEIEYTVRLINAVKHTENANPDQEAPDVILTYRLTPNQGYALEIAFEGNFHAWTTTASVATSILQSVRPETAIKASGPTLHKAMDTLAGNVFTHYWGTGVRSFGLNQLATYWYFTEILLSGSAAVKWKTAYSCLEQIQRLTVELKTAKESLRAIKANDQETTSENIQTASNVATIDPTTIAPHIDWKAESAQQYVDVCMKLIDLIATANSREELNAARDAIKKASDEAKSSKAMEVVWALFEDTVEKTLQDRLDFFTREERLQAEAETHAAAIAAARVAAAKVTRQSNRARHRPIRLLEQ